VHDAVDGLLYRDLNIGRPELRQRVVKWDLPRQPDRAARTPWVPARQYSCSSTAKSGTLPRPENAVYIQNMPPAPRFYLPDDPLGFLITALVEEWRPVASLARSQFEGMKSAGAEP